MITTYTYPADGRGYPISGMTAEDVAIARLTTDGAQYMMRRFEPIFEVIAILPDGQVMADEVHIGGYAAREMTEAQATAAAEDLDNDRPDGHEDVKYDVRDTGRQTGWELIGTRSINDRNFTRLYAGSALLSIGTTETEAWAQFVPEIVTADWPRVPAAMTDADYDEMTARIAADDAAE